LSSHTSTSPSVAFPITKKTAGRAAELERDPTAPEHALDTTAYPISAIQQVVDAKRLTDTASAATLANADVLLTSARTGQGIRELWRHLERALQKPSGGGTGESWTSGN
jgi:hypothetical protein